VPWHKLCYLGLFLGVGLGGKSERNNSPTGSVPFVASGRVRRFLRRCSVGVRFGVGVTVNFGVAVGEAAVSSAIVVADAAVGSGITVGDAALSSCVGVGTSIGLGVATIGASIAACSRVGLCPKNWATPEVIAAAIETIPNAIAQRARRWVCRCLASLCLISISLRISASRSDAVMISFGGSVG
jgi:hypothetical protein